MIVLLSLRESPRDNFLSLGVALLAYAYFDRLGELSWA
jgi:hypothetical protein